MLNKCVLMGRLTRDPVLRHTQTNTPVTSFTLAIERSFKSGEQRQSDFIDIVCWEKLAEFTANYFIKGQLVAVVGRLQQRQWEDKEGNKRTSYEVVANEAHFAERKQQTNDYQNPYGQQAPRRDDYYNNNQPAYNSQPSYNSQPPAQLNSYAPAPAPAPAPVSDSTGFTELMEDDGQLPF